MSKRASCPKKNKSPTNMLHFHRQLLLEFKTQKRNKYQKIQNSDLSSYYTKPEVATNWKAKHFASPNVMIWLKQMKQLLSFKLHWEVVVFAGCARGQPRLLRTLEKLGVAESTPATCLAHRHANVSPITCCMLMWWLLWHLRLDYLRGLRVLTCKTIQQQYGSLCQ